MIRLGLTLRAEADPRHIWIVLSDPAESPDGAILLVNLTTFTEKCARLLHSLTARLPGLET